MRASLVIVTAVLATACSRDRATSETAAPSSSTAAAQTSAATTPKAAAPGEVVVGKPPPQFVAKAHDGTELSLAALKGKPVVVYFYPKDETPGCTKEANSFREVWKDLEKENVVVVGISDDDDDSHRAFAKHWELPFPLVSDTGGRLRKLFGVPPFGRQTFVIGADGNVKKIYRSVDVSKHAAEVMADLQS
jgi:peroxiredoxin Q/BCP